MSKQFSFHKNELIVNSNRVSFSVPIHEVIEDKKDGVVVLLKPISGQSERNVYYVNPDGTIKWQIQHLGMPEELGYQGYMTVKFVEDGTLEAFSFRGVECKIDIETGKIYDRVGTKD